MKKMSMRKTMMIVGAAAISFSLLIGCSSANAEAATFTGHEKAIGTILLSVNPEIEVEYDDNGLVLEIVGVNEDGRSIVTEYPRYEGKECDVVVNELVEKMYESGYFEQTVGGRTKNIVIKLEEGSIYPDDVFLEKIAQRVRDTVSKHDVTSIPVTIDRDDFAKDGKIGLIKAKELVLAQLGLEEASFSEKEYDLDDGIYEFEFTADGISYEFEVNAVSGKVMEADYERNDDWKHDRDDWDDDDDDRDDRDDDDDDRDDWDDDDDDRDDWDDDDDDRDDWDDDDNDD